ncbi:MAG: glyoxalase family protein [Candidatus Ryanbacteria bacterium CG10_big_fil_rev_8_21_14_0_10_43_42]|uniref:Glyoxalase family protein n=1 Tax=Candidatus Ryanbacteria bacterium CG10_big_fil_rev_8_21_14_0_10_43_42 TaxID=1974864 RepID=A0A2M8KWN3_9BACT|nr:MAG: glyoxalase family protein [Candidatus Ryanbacteria bacterium CG10_big_fil_rev_8_21_14_0_10_43_42]
MKDNCIQYIELYAPDLTKIKQFYANIFGWKFTDYGEGYTAFTNSGVEGGFEKREAVVRGGPLIILYCAKLEQAKDAVMEGGGVICKDIFSFPGGRRFHFIDPGGNELAVWSDIQAP